MKSGLILPCWCCPSSWDACCEEVAHVIQPCTRHPGALWASAPALCPCPTALTSRQWICLPDTPNYPWPLAHLSLNQCCHRCCHGSVAHCLCLALNRFLTFSGMIYRAVPCWDTFYLNELILLCVSWRPLRVMGTLAVAALSCGAAGGCRGWSRGLGCCGKWKKGAASAAFPCCRSSCLGRGGTLQPPDPCPLPLQAWPPTQTSSSSSATGAGRTS